jgi:hypothetical protein
MHIDANPTTSKQGLIGEKYNGSASAQTFERLRCTPVSHARASWKSLVWFWLIDETQD